VTVCTAVRALLPDLSTAEINPDDNAKPGHAECAPAATDARAATAGIAAESIATAQPFTDPGKYWCPVERLEGDA
jgi:hypothetical protein